MYCRSFGYGIFTGLLEFTHEFYKLKFNGDDWLRYEFVDLRSHSDWKIFILGIKEIPIRERVIN